MSTHMERAQVLADLGRPAQAEEELRRELAEHPENFEAHRLLAWSLTSQAVRPQTQAGAEQAKALLAQAQAEAEEAVRLQPNYDRAHRTLGWILLEQRRWKEAEKAIREAIRIEPRDPNHFFFLADLFFKQMRWEESAEAARKGLHIDPDNANCANTLIQALIHMNHLEEAEEVTKIVMYKHPENARTHISQGSIYLKQGKHKEWLRHMLEADRIDPETPCYEECFKAWKSEQGRRYSLWWGYGIGIAICILVMTLFRLFGQHK